jgi:glycosyltransferase involved in cell wall biosynthesis
MKIFEYMASSRPIIASDLVSIKEIAGGTAIYVPPSDKTALAGAILGLKDNPALASEMAQKALNQVSDHTWQRRAGRIIDFLYNQD